MKVLPLADRVLIKELSQKDAERVSASGIIIPVTVSEDKGAKKGEVVAVGPGKYDDGVLVPMTVKVGDTVLFQWGDMIKVDGEEYHMVNESNVLAIIK
ncbi:MAG: co-chaperone GroES [Patescibacteria group bacterium]